MISVFNIFTIGIGPSSSHTVGPMRACLSFVQALARQGLMPQIDSVKVELFGSLGLTGKAHGSDRAIILGLLGEKPEDVNPMSVGQICAEIKDTKRLKLQHTHVIPFDPEKDITFHRRKSLPFHPNGMRLACFRRNSELLTKTYYSVGGGFVIEEGVTPEATLPTVPHAFTTAHELLEIAHRTGKKIYEIVRANELSRHSEDEILNYLAKIWQTMQNCIDRGLKTDGILPGGLKVERRAPQIYKKLTSESENSGSDPLKALDWVDLYAIAVGEENAAGGQVVTAPTNGAAGIIPAVLKHYSDFSHKHTPSKVVEFLLTAAGICILFKENASISGADVGCQGEVGVACSMAAGGLTAVLGGSNAQIENAAEIGMEHNLGLTCDPIGGLVQIPCIERNAMGAVKAINAARLAMKGDGRHMVSLDKVIKTMRDTGRDMQSKYKETSRGGLAANFIEC